MMMVMEMVMVMVTTMMTSSHPPRYRFRVKAVNKLGQSLPCDMKGGAIVIKVRKIRKQFRGGDQGDQRSKWWVGILAFKGNGWLQLLQKPGNLFPFRVLFIRVFPDDISPQVGVNVTRKIVRCRYTSDGPWPLWLTLQLEILSTKHFPSVSIRQRLSCKTVCELQSLRCVAYRTRGGLLHSLASRRFLTGKTKRSCCMLRKGPFITSYNFFAMFHKRLDATSGVQTTRV